MNRATMLFVIGLLGLFASTAARKPWHQAASVVAILVAFLTAPA